MRKVRIPLAGRVLVAEDNLAVGILVGKLLTTFGLDYAVVSNGSEAIQSWGTGNFDLLLLDVQMPVVDGLQATRLIRGMEADTGKRVPIIAFTAKVYPEDIARCRQAGMDDYLPKPSRSDDIYRMLQKYLPSS